MAKLSCDYYSLTEAIKFVIFVCSCLCLCSVYKKNLIFKKNNVGEGGEVRDGMKSGLIDFLLWQHIDFVNVKKNQSKDQEDDNEQSDRLSNVSTNLSM